MLLVWLVPVLWTGLPDLVGLVIALVVLAAGVAGFFLSMFRLHRQMVAVKEREIATARELYGAAYELVHEAPTLEVLERQQGLSVPPRRSRSAPRRFTIGLWPRARLPASRRSSRA